MGEEGEPQGIHREMSFNPIRRFVKAETFGVHTGIAGVLHRLRVNQEQSGSLWVF